MPVRLVGIRGPLSGALIDLKPGETTLGRDPSSDVELRDSAVSRHHCLIRREGGDVQLIDRNSRHGTFVNGRRVSQQRLANDDRIALGRSAFVFTLGDGRRSDASISVEVTAAEPGAVELSSLPAERSFLAEPTLLERSPSAAQDLELIRHVIQATTAHEDLGHLCHELLRVLFETLPAERGGILLLDPSLPDAGRDAVFGAVHTWGSGRGPGRRVYVSRSVARRVIRERTALLGSSLGASQELGDAHSLGGGELSLLCVPIVLFERVVGVVYLDSSASHARFDEHHLDLATSVARTAAMPLVNAYECELRARPRPPLVEGDSDTGIRPVSPAQAAGPSETLIVFRSSEPLHLGGVIALRSGLATLPATDEAKTVLFLDYRLDRPGPAEGLPDAWLDRLAAIHDVSPLRLVRASLAPSIAKFAALIAASLRPRDLTDDPRVWFQEILLNAALVLSQAALVSLEPDAASAGRDPGLALEMARALVGRLNKASQASRPRPVPLGSPLRELAGLDGRGAMGASPRGTLYLSEPPERTAKKIRSARTDNRPALDPGAGLSPEICNLLLIHQAVSGQPTSQTLALLNGRGYGSLKDELADAVNGFLAPLRARRSSLDAHELSRSCARESQAFELRARVLAEALSLLPERLL